MDNPRLRPLDEVTAHQRILAISPYLDQRDNLLAVKLPTVPELWDSLAEVQYHLCKFTELPYFCQEPAFLEARDTLEIGFGNEALVGGLGAHFPGKNIVGLALPTHLAFSGQIKTKEILKMIDDRLKKQKTKKFDYIILRVILQKVSQMGLFINSVVERLKPDGRLLIIDAADELLEWVPAIPTFDKVVAELTKSVEDRGGSRTAAIKAYRKASIYGLQPERKETVPVQTYDQVGLRNFYIFFMVLSEIVSRGMNAPIDQFQLIKDLNHWIQSPTARAQIGIHFVQLQRV